MDTFGLKEKIDAQLIRAPGVGGRFRIWSTWDWEQWRQFKGGYELIDTWKEPNVCTDEGLTSNLGVYFSGDTQITSWYIGVFEDNYTPLITNTYATPGFTECTAYDETTRPAWQEAGAAAKAITNAANKATFTFNAGKTVYGGFLVGGGTDPNTKGNTGGGGVLFCSSQFTSGSKAVVSTDILKVSVALSASDT
jgi:hypothetical protein